jgi:Fe-S-cluster containining protein
LKAELRGDPCVEHACALCCYHTEMPLTESDIHRIEGLGHRREDFMVLDEDLVPQLVNDGDHCVFLGTNGRCTIYQDRPQGCRLYPLVWDRETNKVVRDDFCPWNKEFPSDPQKEAALLRVLSTLESEAANRKTLTGRRS